MHTSSYMHPQVPTKGGGSRLKEKKLTYDDNEFVVNRRFQLYCGSPLRKRSEIVQFDFRSFA